LKVQKKHDLRNIQSIDAAAKGEVKTSLNAIEKGNKDFADHNVFSYVYS